MSMTVSDRGSSWPKIILVQLGIVAALLVLYKVYLPRMQRHNLARDTEAREQRIQKFTRTMIVEDTGRDASGTGVDGQSVDHPQKLLQEDSVDEVQQALGAQCRILGCRRRSAPHVDRNGSQARSGVQQRSALQPDVYQ